MCGWCGDRQVCLERLGDFKGCGDSWLSMDLGNSVCPVEEVNEEEIVAQEQYVEDYKNRMADVTQILDVLTEEEINIREVLKFLIILFLSKDMSL
jgi:hypothetical protein